jgi:hypothetical protein
MKLAQSPHSVAIVEGDDPDPPLTPEEHEEIGHWFKDRNPEIAVRHYQQASAIRI